VSLSLMRLGSTKITIHITFVVAAIILSLCGYGLQLIVFAGSLLVHELGHVMGAAFMGADVTSIELWPFGAVAKIEKAWQLSPSSETMVALAGPLNSGLLACTASFVQKSLGVPTIGEYPLLDLLIRFNFGLFALNLIPCLPLDGGRFLRAQISLKTGFLEASKKVSRLGLFMGMVLTIGGILGLLLGKESYAIVITGALITWGAIEEKNGANFTNILDILTRNDRLRQRRAIPVTEILVPGDARVNEVVTKLSPSKYNVFLVAGKKMRIIGKVSEARVLEAFYKGNIHQTMLDLLEDNSHK
jgi:stage IV sporulation protein FB